jgi:hypothetical protein
MNARHTPGPWIVENGMVYALDETGRVNRFSAMISGGYVTHRDHRTSLDELIANVRLIAAAPDLLAALQQIVEIGRTDYGPAAASRMVDAAVTALSRLQEERR